MAWVADLSGYGRQGERTSLGGEAGGAWVVGTGVDLHEMLDGEEPDLLLFSVAIYRYSDGEEPVPELVSSPPSGD